MRGSQGTHNDLAPLPEVSQANRPHGDWSTAGGGVFCATRVGFNRPVFFHVEMV